MSIDRAFSAPPRHVNSEHSLVMTLCTLFELTRAEGRALLRLAKFDHCSREELHRAMSDGDPVTGPHIVDVTLSRLRKKLQPHGIEIATIHRLGFRLDSRDEIREQLAAYGEDVVAAATPSASLVERKKTKSEAA